jgi:hypothetical protein
MLLLVATAASLTVFLLAIFHVIPRRAHVVRLLLGLGTAALILGFVASYWNYRGLPGTETGILCSAAGPPPADDAQRAALVGLPLFLGAATLAADVLGCRYMAAFWGAGWLSRRGEQV